MQIKEVVFAGIDPGTSKSSPGAIAVINDCVIDYFRWPGTVQEASQELKSWLEVYDIKFCVLERVTGNLKWNRSAIAKLFTNFGEWRALLAANEIPYQELTANQWQKGLINKCDGNDSKERVRAFISRYFPRFELPPKKDHGILDALSMAVKASERGKI